MFQKKIKRVLVVGGRGFIGYHVMDALVDNQYLASVLDNSKWARQWK